MSWHQCIALNGWRHISWVQSEKVNGSAGTRSPMEHIKNRCQEITSSSTSPSMGQEVANINFCSISHEVRRNSFYHSIAIKYHYIEN